MSPRLTSPQARTISGMALLALLGTWSACSNSNNSPPPIGIADEPVVSENSTLPGVVVTIASVTSPAGVDKARVGDSLTVEFSVATEAGAPLELATMARGAIMVSGPTFNYQRVIPSQSDLLTRAIKVGLGRYRYTFPVRIPTVYEAPLNDTTALTEGELTGQELLSGTYTVGIELRKDYTVNSVVYRDPGNTTRDFLLGTATVIEPREVVSLANCNQCHGELRAHGDNRNNLTNCLLCHTSGAEDRNTATVANGTPGLTIDFKVMIHKIHAGKSLPSVNGVATNPDGTRNYAATKQPYQIIGYGNNVIDFSEVAFPVWPSLAYPMPRDIGYGALTSDEQALENLMRSGPVDCAKCHGDPDGTGPATAPAQGDLAYTQPSVAACASCHDDWNPDYLYNSNNQTMPIERDNAACKQCHRPSGTALDVIDAHRHPLTDADFAQGIRFDVQSVTDIGDGDGTFDAGEKVQVTMAIKNAAGDDVPATDLSRIETVLNGPTVNPNVIHYVRVPSTAIGAGPIYTFNLPQPVYYEPVGISDGGTNGEVFATDRAPHWNVSGATTSVLRRTGTGASSTLATGCSINQNYLDLSTGGGAGFSNGNYVVIEDAVSARREYLRVQWVEGDRLWFSSLYSQNYAPGVRMAHTAGSTVDVVTTASVSSSSYSLDAVAGTITETTEFGAGEILVSYTTDFVVPENYPGAFNESPDLDQSWGDWIGLPLLSGTYQLGVHGARSRTYSLTVGAQTQTTSYNEGAPSTVTPLLFGDATATNVVRRIDDTSGCYRCHEDIQFHGGNRRGVDACLLCHGTAGSEDAALYLNPAATVSTGVTIDFRTMLHKIHHGKHLDAGASYEVAGFGGSPHTYEMVGFPFMPGETSNCASCHGKDNDAWVEPAARNHPLATLPTRSWRAACGSCHDSAAEQAHIDANTAPSGGEACAICHGIGEEKDVRTVHTVK